MTQRGEVPGSFGLRDFQDSHYVANAEFPVIEQEPKHLEPRFIGECFKKTGCFLHCCLPPDDCILISGLTNAVKRDSGRRLRLYLPGKTLFSSR
jgi:hypothetical protein